MKLKTNWKIIFFLGILFFLVTYVYFADPSKGPILPCVFHEITGYYCPGCGMTRAINSLLHFNFYSSIRYNAILIIVIPILLIYYYYYYRRNMRKEWLIWIAIGMAIIYSILRNLSFFSYLIPTSV